MVTNATREVKKSFVHVVNSICILMLMLLENSHSISSIFVHQVVLLEFYDQSPKDPSIFLWIPALRPFHLAHDLFDLYSLKIPPLLHFAGTFVPIVQGVWYKNF